MRIAVAQKAELLTRRESIMHRGRVEDVGPPRRCHLDGTFIAGTEELPVRMVGEGYMSIPLQVPREGSLAGTLLFVSADYSAGPAREDATRLAFSLGFRKPPPPETLFVQRKLGGTFLLCARLGARFDARSIIEEELA